MHIEYNDFEYDDLEVAQMAALNLLEKNLSDKELTSQSPEQDLDCWASASVSKDPDGKRLHLQFFIHFQQHGKGRPLLSEPIEIDHYGFEGGVLKPAIVNAIAREFNRQYPSTFAQTSTA